MFMFEAVDDEDSGNIAVLENVSLPRDTVGDQTRSYTAPVGSFVNLREELRKMVSTVIQKRGNLSTHFESFIIYHVLLK